MMIAYFPNHKYGYSNKGFLYSIDKNYQEALKYFFMALDKDSNDSLVLSNIATTYKKMWNLNDAQYYYEKVIQLNNSEYFVNKAKEELQQLKAQKKFD